MATKIKPYKPRTFEGLPVVDAKKRVEFQISKSDISNSKKKDPSMCAAAVACQRKFHTKETRVFLTRTYIKTADKWVRYATPPAISREIVAFDRGANFEPGVYVLSPINPSARLGMYRGGKVRPTGVGKPINKRHMTADVRSHAKGYPTK
jgi:hypothetical protein